MLGLRGKWLQNLLFLFFLYFKKICLLKKNAPSISFNSKNWRAHFLLVKQRGEICSLVKNSNNNNREGKEHAPRAYLSTFAAFEKKK